MILQISQSNRLEKKYCVWEEQVVIRFTASPSLQPSYFSFSVASGITIIVVHYSFSISTPDIRCWKERKGNWKRWTLCSVFFFPIITHIHIHTHIYKCRGWKRRMRRRRRVGNFLILLFFRYLLPLVLLHIRLPSNKYLTDGYRSCHSLLNRLERWEKERREWMEYLIPLWLASSSSDSCLLALLTVQFDQQQQQWTAFSVQQFVSLFHTCFSVCRANRRWSLEQKNLCVGLKRQEREKSRFLSRAKTRGRNSDHHLEHTDSVCVMQCNKKERRRKKKKKDWDKIEEQGKRFICRCIKLEERSESEIHGRHFVALVVTDHTSVRVLMSRWWSEMEDGRCTESKNMSLMTLMRRGGKERSRRGTDAHDALK